MEKYIFLAQYLLGMTGYMGIDTHYLKIKYTKNCQVKRFKSLVGIGVSTRDFQVFGKAYDNAIQKSLKSCDLKQNRDILCNFDFLKLFQECRKPIHQIFFNEIAPHIESINVFYTLFNPTIKMRWMGYKEKELKHKLSKPYLEFDEILDKVVNYFPAICVWRIKDFLNENNISCHLDNFSLQPCDAWKEIKDMPLKVFFSGDKCNPLISTADIVINLLQLRLAKARKFYQYGNFRSILPELNNKVFECSISHRHYNSISPLDNKLINLRDYMQHPIIYILNESEFIDSNELKSDSIMDKVYNLAYAKCGCVKIYDKKEDKRHIKDGDYIIYFTDKGKNFVEILKKMKKKINGLNIGDL